MKNDNDCCDRVIPINAARRFKNPAAILKHQQVSEIFSNSKFKTILEIGGGCLRNSLFLLEKGYKITVLEEKGIKNKYPDNYQKFLDAGGILTHEFPPSRSFHIIVCTFVLETICRPEQRKILVAGCYSALRKECPMIVSARGPADLITAKRSGVQCSDGYLTPNRTFSRSYTRSQMETLLKGSGFRKIDFLHKTQTMSPKILNAIAWKDKK